MSASIKPTKKKKKTSTKKQNLSIWHHIGPFDDKAHLHVIASLRRFKEHGWPYLFFDASIVVDHYIDTLSSPQPLATFIPHALAKVELSYTIKWGQRQTFVLLIWGAQISFK
jgi:hypothetical protein